MTTQATPKDPDTEEHTFKQLTDIAKTAAIKPGSLVDIVQNPPRRTVFWGAHITRYELQVIIGNALL
jgi:hypothetical protein